MSSTAQSKPIELLSANVLDTRFEGFDQATLDNTKNRIIDVIGCLIGGANADGNLVLVDLVKEWGGEEEATILAHGGKVPAHNAAMVNSVMARSFEFEVLVAMVDGVWFPSHISGTTITTAIALGEVRGINGKELITAILVGDDIAARVLGASGFRITRGWDSVGTVSMIGATATAGRLLGLNRRQMRHAFGIALNQLAGSFQNAWDGSTAFKLLQGTSARNGIFSAQLAKAGWTGPEDALLSKFGYYHLYTEGCVNPEILTKDLGKTYYTECAFKPYPCCRGAHPAIDCALALVGKHDIKTEDIEEVVLYAPEGVLDSFLGQPFRIGDFPHGNASFNSRYITASALLRKSVMLEHFSAESIRDPQINNLINKIRLAGMTGDPTLNAKLGVKMRDGREFFESTDAPKGAPVENPLSKDEIIAKFRDNIDFSQTMTRDNAEKVLKLLDKLEELDNVNRIVEHLVI
ncbi:MAG TPA: MmgE/PrpD family protein [Dehalococcoidia bacterium]|nr:MmgE/PrpD family protein [Dehalococcoidia bacterium]